MYVVSRFIGALDIRAADSLANTVVDMWPAGKFDIKTKELPGVFVEFPDVEDVIPSLIPLLAPKGHHYLGEIFATPELQSMYEEFMEDPFIYRRFLSLCSNYGIPVKPEMITSSALPIIRRTKIQGNF